MTLNNKHESYRIAAGLNEWPLDRWGMMSLKSLLLINHQEELRAVRHRLTRTKRTAFHGLALAATRRRWGGVVAHAVALAGMRLLRRSRLMRASLRGLRLWAATARVAMRSRAARALHSLGVAVQLARDNEDWAILHRQAVLQRGALNVWREMAAAEVSERVRTHDYMWKECGPDIFFLEGLKWYASIPPKPHDWNPNGRLRPTADSSLSFKPSMKKSNRPPRSLLGETTQLDDSKVISQRCGEGDFTSLSLMQCIAVYSV